MGFCRERRWNGQLVAFTDPVNITVQFKQRAHTDLSDCVRFSNWPGLPENMRLVHDQRNGDACHFAFMNLEPQIVDTAQGTVSIGGFAGLTGADGRGTFGAVARTFSTPASNWSLYR